VTAKDTSSSRGVDRQIHDLDTGVVQLPEQAAQRGEGAVARAPAGKACRLGQGDVSSPAAWRSAPGRRTAARRVHPECGLELGGVPSATIAAVVEHGDPVGEPVGLVEVWVVRKS